MAGKTLQCGEYFRYCARNSQSYCLFLTYVFTVYIVHAFFYLSWRNRPLVGLGLPHSLGLFSLDNTQRHTTVGRSPLDE